MIRVPLAASFLFAACASAGMPSLEPGTRRAAFAFDFSTLETDIEGGGSVDTDTIELEGDIGWFVAPRTEVGLSPSFTNSETDDGTDDVELTALAVGPYVRYYFPSGGAVMPFVDGRFAFADQEVDVNGTSLDGDGIQWALGGGLLAPLSPSVAVELAARYANGDFEIEDADVETDGFQLMIGFAAFF